MENCSLEVFLKYSEEKTERWQYIITMRKKLPTFEHFGKWDKELLSLDIVGEDLKLLLCNEKKKYLEDKDKGLLPGLPLLFSRSDKSL